jgi:hypothetical protein
VDHFSSFEVKCTIKIASIVSLYLAAPAMASSIPPMVLREHARSFYELFRWIVGVQQGQCVCSGSARGDLRR